MFFKIHPFSAIGVQLCLSIFLVLQGCERRKPREIELTESDREYLKEGEEISRKYCAHCHLYPGPELLERDAWPKVLAGMRNEAEKEKLKISGYEWISIQEFYRFASPEKFKNNSRKRKMISAHLFKKENQTINSSGAQATTVVKFLKGTTNFCIGNEDGEIKIYDKTDFKKELKVNNIPIDLFYNINDKSIEVLGIGSLLPSEDESGILIKIDSTGDQKTLIKGLKRPVHFLKTDLNKDGSQEFLISCFGSTSGQVNSGKLSVFQLIEGKYQEKVVKAMPGASKAIVGDFDKDGLEDIIALFSQGKESLILFENKGNFSFKEKVLLEFPPIYGSNDFLITDINSDSLPDIIYTNGDNLDYSSIYKPYHGLRIFLNKGNNQFIQSFFYNLHGASKILAEDFDRDKDLDLVVLSMYPDLEKYPEETFVYFENRENLNFISSFVEKWPTGKWLVMDAGDLDSDGDPDLILGSNTSLKIPAPDSFKKSWSTSSSPFSVFKNSCVE